MKFYSVRHDLRRKREPKKIVVPAYVFKKKTEVVIPMSYTSANAHYTNLINKEKV